MADPLTPEERAAMREQAMRYKSDWRDTLRLLDQLDSEIDTLRFVMRTWNEMAGATRSLLLSVLREPSRAVPLVHDWIVSSEMAVDDEEVMAAIDAALAGDEREGTDAT